MMARMAAGGGVSGLFSRLLRLESVNASRFSQLSDGLGRASVKELNRESAMRAPRAAWRLFLLITQRAMQNLGKKDPLV